MRDTRVIMGMPVTVQIADERADAAQAMEDAFAYFSSIDEHFSPYKRDSEVSRINRSEIHEEDYSPEMKEVLSLALRTKEETGGFFDIVRPDGFIDPSGIVKGWAIRNAARMLRERGFEHFFVDVGGDIASRGLNEHGRVWRVGIRNPFKREEMVRVVELRDQGIATSGTYVRGQHIYNPHEPGAELHDTVSITVIGPDVCEADRFATAAFAMGKHGVAFIETLPGFEAYAIDSKGIATMTSNFNTYVCA